MKAWIISDLDSECDETIAPVEVPDADVCISAGDICDGGPARTVRYLGEHVSGFMPVILVPGNYEYYRNSIVEGLEEAWNAAAERYPDVHGLSRRAIVSSYCFVGATEASFPTFWYAGHRTRRHDAAVGVLVPTTPGFPDPSPADVCDGAVSADATPANEDFTGPTPDDLRGFGPLLGDATSRTTTQTTAVKLIGHPTIADSKTARTSELFVGIAWVHSFARPDGTYGRGGSNEGLDFL